METGKWMLRPATSATCVAAFVLSVALSVGARGLWAADTITRYPYLQPTTDMETSIGIAWETETPSDCVVHYGVKSAGDNKAKGESKGASPRGKQRYYAKLTGLSPGTEYKYKIAAGGVATPEYTFLTSSSKDDFTFRAVLLSDMHFSKDVTYSRPYNEKVIRQMKAFKPHLVLCTGDFAYGPNDPGYAVDEEYETGFTLYRDCFANAILCPVAGNHDSGVANSYDYRIFTDEFYLPENGPEPKETKYDFVKEANYSFTYGGVHVVTLGVGYLTFGKDAPSAMKEPYQWLDKDLSAAVGTGKVRNIIGMAHILEPYSTRRGSIPMSREKHAITYTNVLDKHKTALVLSGHNHSWQRTYPLDHRGDTSGALGTLTTQEKSAYKDHTGVIYQTVSSTFYLYKTSAWSGFAFSSGSEDGEAEDYGTLQVSAGGRKLEVKCYRADVCLDSYTIERDVSSAGK
jgi:predicted MPP superfamily phosphohydrolase